MSLRGGKRRTRKAGNTMLTNALVPLSLYLGARALKKSHKKKDKKHGTRKGMKRKTARRAYMKRK